MTYLDMEQEKRRHGYTSGFEAPRINRDFTRIKRFIDESNLAISGPINKLTNAKTVKKETTSFYSLLFKLHDVCILPKKYDPIFDRYLARNDKTVEEYARLIDKYAVYESPFHIPLNVQNIDTFATGLICYYADGLDETNLPIVNTEIVTSIFTETSSSAYANQICSTQLDRVKGSVTCFHDKEVLGILMEKILAYELKPSLFYEMERLRMFELQGEMELLSSVNNSVNLVWAFTISAVKAEVLFDHYIGLSDNDKKAFFGSIQKIFDGEMTLEEFLECYGIEFSHELAIPAITRNLAIR